VEERELQVGDVVQLSPTECGNPMFGGCMMQVTEPKSWGAQGFVQGLGCDGKQGFRYYYRAPFAEFELVGRAAWILDESDSAATK
jgi:hypothetical protein